MAHHKKKKKKKRRQFPAKNAHIIQRSVCHVRKPAAPEARTPLKTLNQMDDTAIEYSLRSKVAEARVVNLQEMNRSRAQTSKLKP